MILLRLALLILSGVLASDPAAAGPASDGNSAPAGPNSQAADGSPADSASQPNGPPPSAEGPATSTDGNSPPGPPPLGDTLNQMADHMGRVVPPADNAKALEALTQDGIDDIEKRAQAADQNAMLGEIVRTLVQARLNTHYYQGMCGRNYSQPCPFGWTQQSFPDGVIGCTSGQPSEGLPMACNQYNVTESLNAPAKANFALSCKVQWPCSACTRDFSKCPQHFVPVSPSEPGHCMPKTEYVGPCTGTIDFRPITDKADKARWAARCLTKWPCHPE